ncbi:MAG: BglG family transcription antiterminator [Hespellia sp.]|nr:BglG family transcription antiterminator [Hespellia sp.]
MEFNPRIVRILFLLLKSEEPIKADDLATTLKISRRTVFRELDYIESQLKEYHLILKRRSKNGIEIQGDPEDKLILFKKIEKSDDFDPKNKELRQNRLITSLLFTDEIEKVYYYADELKVSETTITNDLEEIRTWFDQNGIKLQKNNGIELVYEEENYRRAVLHWIENCEADCLLDHDVEVILINQLEELQFERTSNLTRESYHLLLQYLTIAVSRIKAGKEIDCPGHQEEMAGKSNIIDDVIVMIEQQFQIRFNHGERWNLHIFVKGCKVRSIGVDYDEIQIENHVFPIRKLIYKMTEVFEPEQSFELQNDEMFVQGLLTHLNPTLTRLVYGLPVKNSLLSQIKEKYPDTYMKAKMAAEVLEEATGKRMSDDEIGFLALHFGGALIRIKQKQQKRRIVGIGVVCSSGIGIASLLASELRYHYTRQIHVTSVAQDQLSRMKEGELDFLISTYPLQSKMDWIQVNPMLTRADFAKISEKIELYAYCKERRKEFRKIDFGEAAAITNEIESIIKNFQIRYVPADIKFQDAVKEAGRVNGESAEEIEDIVLGLTEREKLSSQVIEEYKITFLHTKSNGVKSSRFMIFLPKGDVFSDPYFKKTKVIVIMLIPKADQREKLAVSSIAMKIFEEDDFLEMLKNGDRETIINQIQEILEEYFNDYMKNMYNKEEEETK